MLGLESQFAPLSPPLAGIQQCLCPNPSSQGPQLSARGKEPSLGRAGAILPWAGNLCSGQGIKSPLPAALPNSSLSACTALLLDSFSGFYKPHRINAVAPWLCACLKTLFLPSCSYFFNIFFYYFCILKALPGSRETTDTTSTAVRWGWLWEQQPKAGQGFIGITNSPFQRKRVKHALCFYRNVPELNNSLRVLL